MDHSTFKKVTVIGGGTGSFVVLSGLKKYPLDLSAIITMMDSGGSTGRLRDQLGVLPPGDLRQCLVALSEAPDLWRRLFLYRFESGDLEGHNFGNIFLSALEKVSDNYTEVIETANYVLKTKGRVIPVTLKKTHLCVEYENGTILKEEGKIDVNYEEKSKIKKAYLEPEVEPNEVAIDTLHSTDVLVVAPGDLYTSIIPTLLVTGIKEVIQQSKAKIICIMNLMTKSGQTTNYTASHHIKDLSLYMGRVPDIIVVNNGIIPRDIIEWYKTHDEHLVSNDLHETNFQGRVVEANIVDTNKFILEKSDKLARSILRHDSEKLSVLLYDLIKFYA